MFQFARLDIQEKIEQYQKKYDSEIEKSMEYEKVQKRIDQLLVLKNRIARCEKKIPFSVLGGFLTFFVFWFGEAIAAIIYFIIPFSCMIIGLKAISDRNKYEKKVQNEYIDLMGMDYGELEERSQRFSDCSFNSYHKALDYRTLIRDLESELEHINRFESILENSKIFFTDPYYLADSKEEYEELISKKKVVPISNVTVNDTLLEEYLNQLVDYSNVSFDNQISTPIKYTEKSKRLMKYYKKL